MGFAGIKACIDAMHRVDEEPYEVSLDNYGCCDGPKTGRLRALHNVSFSWRNFSCFINLVSFQYSIMNHDFIIYEYLMFVHMLST